MKTTITKNSSSLFFALFLFGCGESYIENNPDKSVAYAVEMIKTYTEVTDIENRIYEATKETKKYKTYESEEMPNKVINYEKDVKIIKNRNKESKIKFEETNAKLKSSYKQAIANANEEAELENDMLQSNYDKSVKKYYAKEEDRISRLKESDIQQLEKFTNKLSSIDIILNTELKNLDAKITTLEGSYRNTQYKVGSAMMSKEDGSKEIRASYIDIHSELIKSRQSKEQIKRDNHTIKLWLKYMNKSLETINTVDISKLMTVWYYPNTPVSTACNFHIKSCLRLAKKFKLTPPNELHYHERFRAEKNQIIQKPKLPKFVKSKHIEKPVLLANYKIQDLPSKPKNPYRNASRLIDYLKDDKQKQVSKYKGLISQAEHNGLHIDWEDFFQDVVDNKEFLLANQSNQIRNDIILRLLLDNED